MDTTSYTHAFAIFWGLITLGTFVPTIMSKQFYAALLRTKEDAGFVILSGILSLTAGAVSLAFVHDWEWGLVGVITVMGWANVIKGVARFFEVGSATKAVKKVKENNAVVYSYMVIASIFGLYLLYRGFTG